MEFFYDTNGITYEGATLVGIITTLLLIGAGYLAMQGIKALQNKKNKTARKSPGERRFV